MDIVPCIPVDDSRQKLISESLRKSGTDDFFAESASHMTVSITDDRHPEYKQISENWLISNPEGYAMWFESRMEQSFISFMEKARIDDLPIFKRKTPLQRSIQLLKRHRDLMFKDDPDVKPISIIITTLAARAYQGESNVELAMSTILARMADLVNATVPRVPNPVDPGEDFADRWSMPKYKHLFLEQNFRNWLKQAQVDFELLGRSEDIDFIAGQAEQKFSVHFDPFELRKSLGLSLAPTVAIITPKEHIISEPAKPWCKAI
jgi:hypothetical protein